MKPGNKITLNDEGRQALDGNGLLWGISHGAWSDLFNPHLVNSKFAYDHPTALPEGIAARINFTDKTNGSFNSWSFPLKYIKLTTPPKPYTTNELGDFPKREGAI